MVNAVQWRRGAVMFTLIDQMAAESAAAAVSSANAAWWTLGATMLSVIWFRCASGHFTKDHHFAFEAVAWYWHFVDVVWLGLFVFVYVL